MSGRWQISAGELFEMMMPVYWALAALLSSWVLASARRRRFSAHVITLWTLGTLFLPLTVLPLYLIARSRRRRHEKERSQSDANASDNLENEETTPIVWRRRLPVLYLLVILALGALYFYTDSRSVDAHLARANQARVRGDGERVIREYRAALKLEQNAHTHNLLGTELAAMKRWEEALAEFRAAEQLGEPDEELPYNIAVMLYLLERRSEAATEYQRFLRGSLCTETPPDERCATARQRLTDIAAPRQSK